VWSGFVEAPLSDRFQFSSLLGKNEQAAVWIDGKLVYTAGIEKTINRKVNLLAGHRHRIRVEYVNPDDLAELKLLWSSRVVDPTSLPKDALYPALSRLAPRASR
jgi:alpha-L-fucosidase